MLATELTDYRLTKIENVLSTIEENLMQMQKNFEGILDINHKFSDRIKLLENDLQERKIKKYVFNLLVWFYPIVMAVLMFTLNEDHGRLSNIADEVDNVLMSNHELI